MDPEITLAPVPVTNNSQTQEKGDARLLREWELTRRSFMLNYSDSLMRREDNSLLRRNILETIFSGPYSSSFNRLTSPQLASENPSLLNRASKFLSKNPTSSIIAVTCLTVLPSVLACASSATEDLAKYSGDLCYSYFLPSVGVASIFIAITFVAPSIQRYLSDNDEFLLRSRQYRDNLGRNANWISTPNNDGNQAPVPRATALVPALRVEAQAPAQDPAQVPALRVEAQAPAQDPAQVPALRVEAQNQATADSIVSGQLVFFHNQTPAPAPAPAPASRAETRAQSPSLRNDAQDDGRVADSGNDLIQFFLEVGQQGVRGSAQLLAGISTFLSARPREQEVARGNQDTSAEARLVFFSQFQMNQTSERPSDEISSMRARSFQGSPRNLGHDLV